MEGTLSVPPDRGTIIGRAIWKSRYVVVGAAQREQQTQSGRLQPTRGSSKDQLRTPPEGIYLSIYKSKDDSEPIQQHAIGTITDCQVQMLAHRKQGPVLSTLVINIVPDPLTDKLRKRRSSRTAGLTATKETSPTTLLFRQVDENIPLQDWARVIQQFAQPHMPDRTPLSPVTPMSPTFTNPFAPRSRDPGDAQFRPGSGNPGSRPTFQTRSSNQTQSSRDRPVTYSESLSLRSKRSDISSHASSMNPSHIGFQNYTIMHHQHYPTDLPSPASTIGEYQGEFIEGWTSAQGRSSTLSSPVRGRDSVGSAQIPPPNQPVPSSSPPGPRETILDRAFQMRFIPGSDRGFPGEEKLSSLARFEALMREADEKRQTRDAEDARMMAGPATPATLPGGLKSAWDMDDDSDSDDGEPGFDEADEDDSDGPVGEMEQEGEDRFSPASQRALDFIAGRHEPPQRSQPPPRTQGARSPLSYNHEALMALSNSGSHLRPQTGHSKHRIRPGFPQRTHSQPQLAAGITHLRAATQAGVPVPDVPTSSSENLPDDNIPSPGTVPAPAGLQRPANEKRLSASSTKRLSFTEFTKRLSSTSSLLLVQTNTSGSGSRGSNSDMDAHQQQLHHQQQYSHHLYPRGAPAPPQQHQQHPSPLNDRDRCSWRGSVGVFGGTEGGFL
ncbi:hypothetical protein B0H63DRAFT_495699 [Podospora didyma]|uniref:Uncharacterized protein n=1 Tax=Podospora didyma TaxID=330526 RepID=A0AAE0NC42_9PEZI|nr:hypothetical protein B0H63DRAFT_495699 [Podospora didyma]